MNSVLGAKDLPRTVLSDFVEQRLASKLERERAQRAKALGKCPEEVLSIGFSRSVDCCFVNMHAMAFLKFST